MADLEFFQSDHLAFLTISKIVIFSIKTMKTTEKCGFSMLSHIFRNHFNGILYENELQVQSKNKDCSYSVCKPSERSNLVAVNYFKQRKGEREERYTCYYNPLNNTQVNYHKMVNFERKSEENGYFLAKIMQKYDIFERNELFWFKNLRRMRSFDS